MFQFMVPEQVSEFQKRRRVRIVRPERVEVLPKRGGVRARRDLYEIAMTLVTVYFVITCIATIVALPFDFNLGAAVFWWGTVIPAMAMAVLIIAAAVAMAIWWLISGVILFLAKRVGHVR